MISGAAGFILWLTRWYVEPPYHYSILWPLGANAIQLTSLKIYLIINKKDL
jgi:hypothetical protein